MLVHTRPVQKPAEAPPEAPKGHNSASAVWAATPKKDPPVPFPSSSTTCFPFFSKLSSSLTSAIINFTHPTALKLSFDGRL